MKSLAIISFLLFSFAAYSQQRDSVNFSDLDSAGRHKLAQVDSVQSAFQNKYDSIHSAYAHSFSKLDSVHGRLQSKIDSLRNRGQAADKYVGKADSVQQVINTRAQEMQAKLNKVQAGAKEKLQSLDVPPQLSQHVAKANAVIDKMGVPQVKLASAKMPVLQDLPVPGLNIPGTNLNLPNGDLSLGKVTDAVPDLKALGDAGQQVQQATEALGDVNKLGQTAESQLSKIDELKPLQEGTKALDGAIPVKPDLDAEAVKQQAIDQVQQRAVDHFAGKEEQLKKAMDQVAKYKQKYPYANSISDLTKRPPNPYKGKPFVERLVPGLALQYQRKNDYLLDLNLYGGYILNPRFVTGLGWNQRFAYSDATKGLTSRSVIYGPRAFVDYRMGRGFIAHLEIEEMNSFVPSNIRLGSEVGEREWVFGMMTGLKKVFRISQRLSNTVLIQYNIFDRHHKAPYADRLNSRIGLEYRLKKRVKKQ